MSTTALEDFSIAGHAVALAARGLVSAASDRRSLLESILAVHALGNVLRTREAELLAEAERRQAWAGTGCRSMADWLASATKSNVGDAKRKAKLGTAMAANKKLADAVDAGDVSPETAEALADTINTPPAGAGEQHLDELVDACKGASPRDARDAADLFSSTFTPESEEQAAERRHQARSLTFGPARDGLVPVSGLLPAAIADQNMKAWLHAAGTPDGDTRTVAQRLADGAHLLSVAYSKGQLAGGRGAPQMVITMTEATRRGLSNEPAVTDLGTRIPPFEARRLAEIAELRRVVFAGSRAIDLGRQVRYASTDQYLALAARDGGCIWPGCHIPASWCDADHLTEWEHGGSTDLSNLVLLCRHHHTERHRPGVVVVGDASSWSITLANGTTLQRRAVRTPGTAEEQGSLFDLPSDRPPDRGRAAA